MPASAGIRGGSRKRSGRAFLASCILCGGLLSSAPAAAGTLSLVIPGGQFAVPVESFSQRRFHQVVKQQYDFSCGSAALATLLTHHYGKPVGEEAVFKNMFEHGDQAKIKAHGFSLLDMKTYLAAVGMGADGFRISLDKLLEVGLPAIALIDTGNYRHFVVVKGLRQGQVLLGDPAQGLRTVSRADFEKMWNGIFFVVHRGAKPIKNGFNNAKEWAARPQAPLREAVSRADLANFTLGLPRRGNL